MSHGNAVLVLLLAALLETGGDALVRRGLHAGTALPKLAFLAAGGVVLFAYGYTVNAPSWDFGRLLGLYVVFFFLTAQVVSWVAFHQKPSPTLLVGGAFIVLGGAIIAFGQRSY